MPGSLNFLLLTSVAVGQRSFFGSNFPSFSDIAGNIANKPNASKCVSDEDCLQSIDNIKQCNMFCIDGECQPWKKDHPPILTLKSGMKYTNKGFILREGEELEKIFERAKDLDYPKEFEGNDKFFEISDGSDEILEVRYPKDFFKIAARKLESESGLVNGFTRERNKPKGDIEDFEDPKNDNNDNGPSISAPTTSSSLLNMTNFRLPSSNLFRGRDQGRRLLAIQNQGADRRHVTNNHLYPWRLNGRLSMGCTAGLIGNRVLITAAHCVFDRASNSWGSFPTFAAGQDGTDKPYGEKSVWKMTIPSGYITCSTLSSCRAHDWAVLVLYNSHKLNVGYFGFSTLKDRTLNLAGYPQSKNRELWYDYCPLHADMGKWIKHRCDTEPGNSGSAIYKIKNGDRYVVAVHGGGYTNQWNRGADVDGKTSSAGRLYDRMLAYRLAYG